MAVYSKKVSVTILLLHCPTGCNRSCVTFTRRLRARTPGRNVWRRTRPMNLNRLPHHRTVRYYGCDVQTFRPRLALLSVLVR